MANVKVFVDIQTDGQIDRPKLRAPNLSMHGHKNTWLCTADKKVTDKIRSMH